MEKDCSVSENNEIVSPHNELSKLQKNLALGIGALGFLVGMPFVVCYLLFFIAVVVDYSPGVTWPVFLQFVSCLFVVASSILLVKMKSKWLFALVGASAILLYFALRFITLTYPPGLGPWL